MTRVYDIISVSLTRSAHNHERRFTTQADAFREVAPWREARYSVAVVVRADMDSNHPGTVIRFVGVHAQAFAALMHSIRRFAEACQ